MFHKLIPTLLLTFLLWPMSGSAKIADSDQLDAFVADMVKEHQFDPVQLHELFAQVEIKDSIIKAITSPAEGMPWYKYRKIFLTDARIQGGVKFWQENEAVLTAVEEQFGVPAEIITAIIGVETLYGARTGGFRVVDALATLAFTYPRRSKFFTSELRQFLLLCREENMNPLLPKGSYAGAMGMPQFMPSSYRAYAADFEQDGKRDIWGNPADVIASVANYFIRHHWHKGEPVAFAVSVDGDDYKKALTDGLKPDQKVAQLQSLQVNTPEQLSIDQTVKLLQFAQPEGSELWVTLHNFYVITRYNRSPLYAMAVYQLSQAIYQQKQAGHT